MLLCASCPQEQLPAGSFLERAETRMCPSGFARLQPPFLFLSNVHTAREEPPAPLTSTRAASAYQGGGGSSGLVGGGGSVGSSGD
jgi:hypothetical protein